jgi:GGDEF domain-containing protein
MTEADRKNPPASSARRAHAARQHPSTFTRTRIDASPELIAFMKRNPGADLRFGPAVDGAKPAPMALKIPAFAVRADAEAINVGCPNCQADFSVAYLLTDEADAHHRRDVILRCPACAEAVIVETPDEIEPSELVVGPPRSTSPKAVVLNRARVLRDADTSLSVAHSEQMAILELERDEYREEARTDFATGALNERARDEDGAAKGQGHAVLEMPDVQVVYDACGQASGNVYARDVARILALAAEGLARVYRIGTAKFAMIAPDLERVRRATERVNEELRSASTSISTDDGTPVFDPSATVAQFLERHAKPYGLKVRVTPAR